MQTLIIEGYLAADPSILSAQGTGRKRAGFRVLETTRFRRAALTRGRLRHLETLGLATREGRRYRLADDLETRLRTLQVRRDVIRTLNQRRLEGARDIRVLQAGVVRGRVVRTGFHDEAGASPWAVVRDQDGVEHYARLAAGSPSLKIGATATLTRGETGLAQVLGGRAVDLGRGA